MWTTLSFLNMVTRRIPPGKDQKHSLELDDNNWLVLQLRLGEVVQPVHITEGDLGEMPTSLLDQICDLLTEAGMGDRIAGNAGD